MVEWKDEGWQLTLRDGEQILAKARIVGEIGWCVYLPCIDSQCYKIEADTIEEAEWRATLLLYDRCNQVASYYHKIRDKLPSIHELAEKARM